MKKVMVNNGVAWNYDEKENRLIVLSKGKYLFIGKGRLHEDTDFSRIGTTDGSKFLLFNTDRSPLLHTCNA